MNRQIILIVTITLLCCNKNIAQQKTDSTPINMKKFDIELFKKNQKANIYTYHKGDTTVSLLELKDVYRESIYYKNSAFEDHISYFKDELTVKVVYKQLYGMYIGSNTHRYPLHSPTFFKIG